jgi:CxxC motif-containing protein (DUF1111 family)
LPAENLLEAHRQDFFRGNSLFNEPWVTAPATTAEHDGLGPLFNARSCSACHVRDGRGPVPAGPEEIPLALLFRFSTPGDDGALREDPVYGGQIQPFALAGVAPEALPEVRWVPIAGSFDDGSPFELVRPDVSFVALAYGEFAPGWRASGRAAPQMVGLGLLEAIPADRLVELADPDDRDGDGVAGHVAYLGESIGRFGWKAEQPSVLHQAAGALLGDIGITSVLHPQQACTPAQTDCAAAPSGGDPEILDADLARVALYSSLLAVPARRTPADPAVLSGKALFHDLECSACHVPSHVTRPDAPLVELADQLIWPYTDLLLHDLGPELADDRPAGAASGAQWRTPPLWGLGLLPTVNGHQRLLHDGRARDIKEAILWHGGEAAAARAGFVALSPDERDALCAFVASL